MTELLRLKYFYIIIYIFIGLSALTSNKISADQKIKIIADEIQVLEDEDIIEATGNAVAIDKNDSKLKSDKAVCRKNQKIPLPMLFFDFKRIHF